MATIEAHAYDHYKRRIVQASEEDIARTGIFGPEWPDAPIRVIRNRVVREWAGNDTKTPPQPDPPQVIGKTVLGGREYAMPKFSAILPTPETSGDFEEMCLPAAAFTIKKNPLRLGDSYKHCRRKRLKPAHAIRRYTEHILNSS